MQRLALLAPLALALLWSCGDDTSRTHSTDTGADATADAAGGDSGTDGERERCTIYADNVCLCGGPDSCYRFDCQPCADCDDENDGTHHCGDVVEWWCDEDPPEATPGQLLECL